jgi:NADH:ubiquinone oxidoreductase subunit 6 (subunit J)
MIEVILIVITIVFAVLAVELKNLLQAVVALSIMCIVIGMLFGILHALYVMAFQFLIYGGAAMALFLSVVMLTEREENEKHVVEN